MLYYILLLSLTVPVFQRRPKLSNYLATDYFGVKKPARGMLFQYQNYKCLLLFSLSMSIKYEYKMNCYRKIIAIIIIKTLGLLHSFYASTFTDTFGDKEFGLSLR